MYFKYFAAERNYPLKTLKNILGVYGGNALKCNELSKLFECIFWSVTSGYHTAISANFKAVLMKHPV